MDSTQFLQATSSSIRGASGWWNHPINLRPYPYPLDEGKAINSQIMTRRYVAAISLLTVGEIAEIGILSLTPHRGVTDTTLKPPLRLSFLSQLSDFTIRGSVAGTTSVFLFLYSFIFARLWTILVSSPIGRSSQLMISALSKKNGNTWWNRMAFNHMNMVIPNNGACNYFHLNESYILTYTSPWSCIKCYELERWYMHFPSTILPIGYKEHKIVIFGLTEWPLGRISYWIENLCLKGIGGKRRNVLHIAPWR